MLSYDILVYSGSLCEESKISSHSVSTVTNLTETHLYTESHMLSSVCVTESCYHVLL